MIHKTKEFTNNISSIKTKILAHENEYLEDIEVIFFEDTTNNRYQIKVRLKVEARLIKFNYSFHFEQTNFHHNQGIIVKNGKDDYIDFHAIDWFGPIYTKESFLAKIKQDFSLENLERIHKEYISSMKIQHIYTQRNLSQIKGLIHQQTNVNLLTTEVNNEEFF
ncbi:Immunity protein 63 of polymorphic toxin system [Vibrio crassostreae]|uniref:hypothetical protein n=2 Tax=Vibrio crassostreae TaxID=246167 RepID=UPI0005E33C6C|nr:hypothetical protein [Vibrio crassostreae]ROP24405.1 hypothetical protein EDB33_102524 [Vibrio crassostreae]ROP24426.1 hypothetical protein EDB34_10211 [Vibrio crassostreae]RPE99841.1 hypothetical protein EDB15_102524 [Vibrio crassostreae]RPF09974.1 hypothetical protein EDB14_1047 [Vibrio crassostreae]TCN74502.1 hypothetical protein EDB60_101378 [Vibrio crassostreae]